MATQETSFNPGFVQAPTQAEQTQTFGVPSSGATQTFRMPSVPTRGGFMGSLAPMGPGQSATSTVPTYDAVTSGSDSNFGEIAAGVGGGVALAALLNSMGSEGSGSGGGLSISGILGGAQKLYKLAEMTGTDISKMFSEGVQNAMTELTNAPSKLVESISEIGSDAADTVSEIFSGGGDPIGNLPTLSSTGQILGHSGLGAGGIGQGGLTSAGTLVEMGGMPLTQAGALSPAFTAPVAAPASIAGGLVGGLSGMGAGGIGVGGLTSAGTLVEMGGIGAGVGGAGGAGGLASMGAMGPIALAGAAVMAMQALKEPFDPTAETRRLNQIENMMQPGGSEHELTKKFGAGIEGLEEMIYNDPYSLQLIKDATSGSGRAEPFGTPHTSGGTKKISWSPKVSALVQENMPLLEAASAAGQAADPSSDPHGSPPKRYSEVKSGATFHSGNDPYGHHEREAAALKAEGYGDYIPSGRDLQALLRQANDPDYENAPPPPKPQPEFMPIVTRDGVQYKLSGPNDVPSSGNRIGPVEPPAPAPPPPKPAPPPPKPAPPPPKPAPPPPKPAPPPPKPKNYAGSVRLGGNLIYRDGKIHRLTHSGDSASSGNIIGAATAAQIAAYGSAGRGPGGGNRFVDP